MPIDSWDVYEALPVCPHCELMDQDWWDGLGPKSDGDEWEAECSACGKTYSVEMCVTVEFRTSKVG